MAIKLNKAGYDQAVKIIKNGLEIEYSSNWEAVKPTQEDTLRFLNTHTLEEFGSWFLGVNPDADPKAKSKYTLPWGDFNELHKSALIAAQKEAASVPEIKTAVENLLALIEKSKKK